MYCCIYWLYIIITSAREPYLQYANYVRSQHSIHILIGWVLQQQIGTIKLLRPAVPTGQPHLNLVLVDYSKQTLQEAPNFGFGSLFLFEF